MGLTGISALDYFAAHAPEPTPAWYREAREKGLSDMQAVAGWAWAYAQAMIDTKPKGKVC